MLSRCSNPQCSRPFVRLGEGKLFLVEAEHSAKLAEPAAPASRYTRPQSHAVERYWLCDPCARAWTLVPDRGRGVMLLTLAIPPAVATPD
jgi:hypothetical protein